MIDYNAEEKKLKVQFFKRIEQGVYKLTTSEKWIPESQCYYSGFWLSSDERNGYMYCDIDLSQFDK